MEKLSKTLNDAGIVMEKLLNLVVEVEHFRDIILDLSFDIRMAYNDCNIKTLIKKQTLLEELFSVAQLKSPFKEMLEIAVSIHRKPNDISADDLLTVRK